MIFGHLLGDLCIGLGFLAVGSIIGGTVAWYKGWEDGFRQGSGYRAEEESKKASTLSSLRSRRVAGHSAS